MKYIFAILFCKLLQPILNKKCSMELSGTGMFMKYILIRQFVAAGIALVLAGSALFSFDLPMLLFGAAFALCLTVCTYAGIAAMQNSAMVLVSFFEMAGLLVPCILGVFLLSEPLKPAHLLGLSACLISAWLLTGGHHGRISAKGWCLLAACLLSNGGIMLTQKMFAHMLPQGDVSVFHFWGFFLSGLCSLAIYCASRRKGGEPIKVSGKLYVFGIILSASMLAISMLSTLASVAVPAVVLFSVVNGGGLLLCSVISAVIYKEKLTVRMVIGLVLGTLALMIINLS